MSPSSSIIVVSRETGMEVGGFLRLSVPESGSGDPTKSEREHIAPRTSTAVLSRPRGFHTGFRPELPSMARQACTPLPSHHHRRSREKTSLLGGGRAGWEEPYAQAPDYPGH